jgi:hypothetical protein
LNPRSGIVDTKDAFSASQSEKKLRAGSCTAFEYFKSGNHGNLLTQLKSFFQNHGSIRLGA